MNDFQIILKIFLVEYTHSPSHGFTLSPHFYLDHNNVPSTVLSWSV